MTSVLMRINTEPVGVNKSASEPKYGECHYLNMNDEEARKEIERRVAEIKRITGHTPVSAQILKDRPDLLLPNMNVSDSVLAGGENIPQKYRHLIALSAAVAGGSPYCIRAQMNDARLFGATEDEVLETIQISSYMGMTLRQSTAYRVFADVYGRELEE